MRLLVERCTLDTWYEKVELKDSIAPLQRRMPDPSIAIAKQRSREMIFTCLMMRLRLMIDPPLETWKQIFYYVNRAEHAF